MKRYDKLILVSNSNTLRGPMAEGIMKSKYLLGDLEIESRGLVVLFPEPINQKAEAVLKSHGISMKNHRAEVLKEEDFDERNLILALDETDKLKIFENYENAVNVYLLSAFVGSTEEIQNPLGGTLQDYGACYELIESLIAKLVIKLNEEELLC